MEKNAYGIHHWINKYAEGDCRSRKYGIGSCLVDIVFIELNHQYTHDGTYNQRSGISHEDLIFFAIDIVKEESSESSDQ